MRVANGAARFSFAAPRSTPSIPGLDGVIHPRCARSDSWPSAPAHEVHHQDDQEDYQKDPKQDPGDVRCRAGDTAKAQHGCDDGDDQGDQSPVQQVARWHWTLRLLAFSSQNALQHCRFRSATDTLAGPAYDATIVTWTDTRSLVGSATVAECTPPRTKRQARGGEIEETASALTGIRGVGPPISPELQ